MILSIRESRIESINVTQPSLRPQDVIVLSKLITHGGQRPSMAQLSYDLGLSSSEIHASLKRLEGSRLISQATDGHRALLKAVEEFLIHGVKYAFPSKRGEITRGLPTSYGAPPLNQYFANTAELPPVWPSPAGTVRGVSLEPFYRTAAAAAMRDHQLYELLALIDALRDGRVRERQLAERELTKRLRRHLND